MAAQDHLQPAQWNRYATPEELRTAFSDEEDWLERRRRRLRYSGPYVPVESSLPVVPEPGDGGSEGGDG